MNPQKQQHQYEKYIVKILKKSNHTLWRQLSPKQRKDVVGKYDDLSDIKSRGIQNILSDIRQSRISLTSLLLGFIFGFNFNTNMFFFF